jgi:hypothetical protein
MVRALHPSLLAASWLAIGLSFGLAGCVPGSAIDQLPSNIGLPAGAPERPATPYQYPAVHDMPPERATPTMSEAEQVKLEKELQAARDRQEGKLEPAEKSSQAAKKRPVDPKSEQTSGAKTNP